MINTLNVEIHPEIGKKNHNYLIKNGWLLIYKVSISLRYLFVSPLKLQINKQTNHQQLVQIIKLIEE